MASLRSTAAVILLGGTVAALAAPVGAQILPARQYKAGSHVTSMAAGDLNGDGLTDVVCGTYSAAVISVMLRDETGGFLPASSLAVDGSAPELHLGDLNGDDLLDVVSSEGSGGSLSVRLGDGTGGFGPLSVYRGLSINPLTLADLDGDGDDDVAGCRGFDDSVLVLLSDGAGVLVVSGVHPVADNPRSISAADFDLDGALDLLTGHSVHALSLLLGDGAGGFAAAVSLPAPGQINSAIAGDVDEDGDPDVIAITTGGSVLYLGNGDGTFALSPGFSVQGGGPMLADADGDGFLDLISRGSAGYLVQLGQPGPGFDAPLPAVALGEAFYGQDVLAEADGDGWLDLVVGGSGQYSNTVSVLSGLGFGVFETFERVTVSGDHLALELADLDGDQDLDAALACAGNFGGAGVTVLLNDGAGELVSSSHTATSALVDIDAGDVDADGDVDLVAIGQTNVKLLLGDGSGAFPSATSFAPLPQPQFVRLGDFDGDGDDDAAVAHGSSSAGAVAVLLADGAGGFAAPVSHSLGAAKPTALAVGDLDLDGHLDLVVNSMSADWTAVLRGDGAGGFSAPAVMPVPDAPTGIAIGDVTADGLPDLVIGHSTIQPVDTVTVHPGDGAGGFLPAQTWPAGNANGMLAIADVDEDGAADLVVSENVQGGSVVLLLGESGGGFQEPHVHAAGYWPFDLALADIDGDGLTDVLSLELDSDAVSSTISVLRNLGVPEPWTNLGLGLAGSAGIPMLVGQGSLQPGEPVALTLHGAQPASAAFLVIGFVPLLAPFKGGVLVPRPHLIVGGLATDATGSLDLHAVWPSGVPSALTVWYQLWIVDPGAVAGLAGSNGVTSTTP